jgi:beta-galactosidase
MKNLFLAVLTTLLIGSCSTSNQEIISLAGSWQIKLDPQDIGLTNGWMSKSFENSIPLPGTTDENGFGSVTRDTAYGILSREYEYIGPVWYNKEIHIPDDWNNVLVDLFLERVIWESQVFIDGNMLGKQDALAAPHIHHLGQLTPGKHFLSIRINNDMIHNIGDKGHAYGEYMQSIWNGIVGRIELQAKPLNHIVKLRTFPNLAMNTLGIELEMATLTKDKIPVSIVLKEKSGGKTIISSIYECAEKISVFELTSTEPFKPWNEFEPFLYELEVILDPEGDPSKETVSVGFASVGRTEHHITINEEPIFLRGNLDCIHFPLTGYPSTNKSDWLDIFSKYKDFGLNHVRFHSWCPPEAAFEAADELGIYIQAEASVWIDWWMGTDMVARGRPEMDTKGHPQGLGKGDQDADDFIWKEMKDVINTYGNHPSFIMFCIGNELGSSDFNLMGDWIKQLKEADPRRLYAASTARTITEWCDYSATHNVPGIGSVRQKMTNNTSWDYEDKYSKPNVPIIAHEVGQWPVYPDWDEIRKYSGPLKARNLEQLANLAKRNGIFGRDKTFREASGSLSALLYKDEVESFMRTPSCAGFQLLSMQDYIGQGEAVIGWLDSFYEEKGNLEPESARQFINEVVPLVELPAYCFTAGNSFESKVLLFQYGRTDLSNQMVLWKLTDAQGKVNLKGEFKEHDYTKGDLHDVGKIAFEIPNIEKAGQFKLTINLPGTNYKNSWPIWIYPKETPKIDSQIIITKQLSDKTLDELKDGKSVLLIANQSGEDENVKLAAWKPLYWSASFFPGQSIETLGLLVDNQHKALAEFPTENFGSWNWYSLCQKAHGFDLQDFPTDYRPIVEPISDFHYCRRLGSVFELKFGNGKLLVCGYNIGSDRDSLPEARQLQFSLLKYMASEDFSPVQDVSETTLRKMFSFIQPAANSTPGGFEDALLFTYAAALQDHPGNDLWSKTRDKIDIQKEIEYSVVSDGTWKDDKGTAWFGKEITINLSVRPGSIGKVYLFFHDWSNQNRDGTVEIEKRKYTIGSHDHNGKWISLDFMREDSQDGEIIISAKSLSGPNLMISKMAVKRL